MYSVPVQNWMAAFPRTKYLLQCRHFIYSQVVTTFLHESGKASFIDWEAHLANSLTCVARDQDTYFKGAELTLMGSLAKFDCTELSLNGAAFHEKLNFFILWIFLKCFIWPKPVANEALQFRMEERKKIHGPVCLVHGAITYMESTISS